MAHTQAPLPAGDQGQHYATLASLIPQALVNASAHNRAALRQLSPELPGWYISTTQQQKDTLKTFVDEQVSQRGYGTSSEYVRELIRKDQDRQHLRGLLLAGAASAPTAPVDGEYFDALRARVQSARR